jgi:hypothetical protein
MQQQHKDMPDGAAHNNTDTNTKHTTNNTNTTGRDKTEVEAGDKGRT